MGVPGNPYSTLKEIHSLGADYRDLEPFRYVPVSLGAGGLEGGVSTGSLSE